MAGPDELVADVALGEFFLSIQQHRIVGISGYTVRPPQARHEKPRVSAFTSAKVDKILALQPDLAIGFSDMQADIAAALILAGVEVWISNHRSIAGILGYVRRLGALVGACRRCRCLRRPTAGRVEAACASRPRNCRAGPGCTSRNGTCRPSAPSAG
jgi:iron complex transport system substrate-binding protein